MKLTSPAFEHNGNIPSKYTCDGENISPPLEWSEIPENTKSFVLIVDDPDAVGGKTFDHWINFNISDGARKIEENSSLGIQGLTGFGTLGYGGPCPPSGKHRYVFKLYALDTKLHLNEGASKEQIEQAMAGTILEQAELIGLYERKK